MHDITLATGADIDGLAALLQANTAAQGGLLTGEFPREQVARWVNGDMPVLVAHRDDRVVGALFSGPKDDPTAPPPVHAMWTAWPGGPDAYVYGPVCIAESERGSGLLAQLYAALRERLPGREAVLFIRYDNPASLRAHQRLGMGEVASFTLDGLEFAVFSDRPG
ncbi:GNAT family N-acetyltransferase [Crenobacter sp. SG2303]|uniref:GNAT family N-acetyltransferase n=1 Tax=Crenobacter oryzisoli TaxID=3056844 RepID=A0ABT7XNB0_9NEIS|nr:GNAT family N-acetyltransferase [Crenobacter sp. SG2303]MDN0075286.1 GNAT family N-acetyltransferase [Crenobacter sp. SG2303]